MAKRKTLAANTVETRDVPTPPGYPSEVKILGQTYRIIYRTPLVFPDGSGLQGMVTGRDRTILIDPSLPPHMIRETILHEIAHVYLTHSGFESKYEKAKLVEIFCDMFGSAVDDLTQNNDWPTRR